MARLLPRCAWRGGGSSARTHMNHGNPEAAVHRPPPETGPRSRATTLGLEAAQNTSNILRLLEAASHAYTARDAFGTVWHERALCWRMLPRDSGGDNDKDGKWQAFSPLDDNVSTSANTTKKRNTPRLHSLNFSDGRTALVKLTGADGILRYLSLLRLDDASSLNDGWTILREVQVPTVQSLGDKNDNATSNPQDSILSLQQTLKQYLRIEHGGGVSDFANATRLFAPQSSLLAVGMADVDKEPPSAWSAPAGTLLEIPLSTYLEGVKTQTPHVAASTTHDCIATVDVSGCAAMAVVRVGNGAQTLVFEDHLLLGQQQSSSSANAGGVWKILSKTFSPQVWPSSSP